MSEQNRTQRALAHVDIDAHARRMNFTGAKQLGDLTRMHQRLDAGQMPTRGEVEALRVAHYPGIPSAFFHDRVVARILSGRTPRERADRLVDAVRGEVDLQTGVPLAPSPDREQARAFSQNLAVQDFAASLNGKLSERDERINRAHGIDAQREAAENAKRAAMNPDTIRRNDIERAVNQHAGPQPVLYAQDKAEMIAQAVDRNIERGRAAMVRNADRSRDPLRGDDRREDIGRIWDAKVLDELGRDALELREQGLEGVDDALTHRDAVEREDA